MKTLVEQAKIYRAISLSTITGGGTKNGDWVPLNGGEGDNIAFILQAGDLGSVTVLTVAVQGRTKGTDGTTPVDILDKDGNALVFTAAKTIDGAALELGFLIGQIPMAKLPSTIDAVRLAVTVLTGANAIVGAIAQVFDLKELHPTLNTDDLLPKLLPGIGAV